MLRIPRIVRKALSLSRPVQTLIQKRLANQSKSLSDAAQSAEQVKQPSPNGLKISELISRNVEAEAFILERFQILSSNIKIGPLMARIKNQIKTRDPKKIVTNDLKLLVHIGENESDIDLLVEGIKLYMKDEENLRVYRFGPQLMKLLVVLEKTERAFELFQDKDLEPAFRGPASANVLIKKYLYQKNYGKVLEIFELQKQHYTLENLNLRPDLKVKINQKAQAVPVEHMQSVALALLHLNQPESCVKGKELVKFAIEKSSNLSNLTVVRLFTLAINQNDLELAELAVAQLKSTEYSMPLILNLTAIIKAKQNQLDEAFKTIDAAFKVSKDDKLKLNGCLFSDVIIALVECIKNQSKSVDETTTNSHKTKLKAIMERLKAEKRLFRQDIFTFCTEKY